VALRTLARADWPAMALLHLATTQTGVLHQSP
jgi:hypothetical protein